jgi:hypothetical protein
VDRRLDVLALAVGARLEGRVAHRGLGAARAYGAAAQSKRIGR